MLEYSAVNQLAPGSALRVRHITVLFVGLQLTHHVVILP